MQGENIYEQNSRKKSMSVGRGGGRKAQGIEYKREKRSALNISKRIREVENRFSVLNDSM